MERAVVSKAQERAQIKARVRHLAPQDQVAVERATRILRAYFEDRRASAPKRGTLLAIMLVAPITERDDEANAPPGNRSHLELWAFVNDPAFKGLDKQWGRAREMLASELPMATTSLSVFTPDEMERARIDGNRFLVDKFDAGVVLYGVDLAVEDVPPEGANEIVRCMLRMALALLDRDGLTGAACDVSSALEKLGETWPALSDHEASALLDSWASRRPGPSI